MGAIYDGLQFSSRYVCHSLINPGPIIRFDADWTSMEVDTFSSRFRLPHQGRSLCYRQFEIVYDFVGA